MNRYLILSPPRALLLGVFLLSLLTGPGTLRAQQSEEDGWRAFEESMRRLDRMGEDMGRWGEEVGEAASRIGEPRDSRLPGAPGEAGDGAAVPVEEGGSGLLGWLFGGGALALGGGLGCWLFYRRRAAARGRGKPREADPSPNAAAGAVPPPGAKPVSASTAPTRAMGTRIGEAEAATAVPPGPGAGGAKGLPAWLRAILGGPFGERYQQLEEIGAGGMGVVLRGQDTRLARTVAIKVPPPHLATLPEFRARFLREARALARLKHPNIGGVYDVTDGETGDCPVMVMEYLEGQTLLDLLREAGQLPLDTARGWIRQLGRGLVYVHSQGVLHRDVKPANLMLVKGEVKILDFGLASLEDGTRLTRTGGLGGSIGYMPPEQIRGEHVDQRADVYALAATAYQLLAGQLPFRASDKMRRDIPRISTQREGLSQALDPVFERALAAYAEERTESVEAFLVELESAFSRGGQAAAPTRVPGLGDGTALA